MGQGEEGRGQCSLCLAPNVRQPSKGTGTAKPLLAPHTRNLDLRSKQREQAGEAVPRTFSRPMTPILGRCGSLSPGSTLPGLQEELSQGKICIHSVFQEQCSLEHFNLGLSWGIFFLEQPSLFQEKKPECLHTFIFYQENSNFLGRN